MADSKMSCSAFLKKYSGEPQLIPLNKLAVHIKNRGGKPLSGKNVETLLKSWDRGSKEGGEDFQLYRYKPARVAEADPNDLYAFNRHTNAMADMDPMIRSVSTDVPIKYGLFSKSHCWSALWGMTGRGIQKGTDVDSVVFSPPDDQADLKFTEENGMWCEVVKWEGVRDHPDVFRDLMNSENYDSARALPADEVGLLAQIMEKLDDKVKTRSGEREYDALVREILACPGQIFDEKDVQCRYNIAKVLGAVHLEFLTQFCGVYVDFKSVTMPNKAIQALTKLPAQCPWLKIALLVDNYNTDSPAVYVGKKGLADNWSVKDIDDIAAHWKGKNDLQDMEALLKRMLDFYSVGNWKGVSTELLHKKRCQLVEKVGQTLRSKKKDGWREEFFDMENSLRRKLPQSLLDARVVEDTRTEEEKSKSEPAASSQKSKQPKQSTQVDEAPKLQFDDGGKVCENMALQARSKGLAVGSTCQATNSARGIKRDRFGVIVSFNEKDVRVKFDQTDDESESTVNYSLKALQLAEKPKPEAADPPPAGSPDVQQDPPKGIAWQPYDEKSIGEAMAKQIAAFNDQLSIQHAPTHDQVCVLEEPRVLVARMDLPAFKLKIMPRAKDVTLLADSTKCCPDKIDIKVQMQGRDTIYYRRVQMPPDLGHWVGSVWTIDVAEFVDASSAAAKAHAGGFTTLTKKMTGDLDVSALCPYSTDDKNWKPPPKKKTESAKMSAQFQYWTNDSPVKMNEALVFQ
jgi:hypothetical protein